ncbi:reductive dehalogenase domain-containing protein [Phytohabitans sp. ZYX-F-186]|uniref:Reductive dehalogenase domain-containing protein n=1 Tax=Phytohabitans maris TaxID=3071409 RepID=A0ABU0ZA18_9ACTN|nr:4Fe-4S dicluster domain-containing protein [Phytohabitans sp. ZYX-F-186]MDQ7903883.1 reductive dehalogenase domain-containing protein [Phytohabitans sp. ZYX-F-186]
MPGNRYARNAIQRWAHHTGHRLSDLLYPLMRHTLPYRPKMWWIPTLPVALHRRRRSPARPWTQPVGPPPEELRTVPGIKLDPVAQQKAMEEAPLHDFIRLNPEMRGVHSPTGRMWVSLLSTSPRVQRAARRRAFFARTAKPAKKEAAADPAALTAALRAEAARLGLSAIGVTHYDKKYNFAEYYGLNVGDTIIVGILEQNYDSTQTAPSIRAEKAALTTYAELEDRMRLLATWIHAQGYKARPEGFVGESMNIPYAVQAGLGQLGLNGQLLSPHAGSRARLHVMSTDAPFVHDEPVDYGIEGICDNCQICVRRCPPGAIPAARKDSRGVMKAKLNTKRCLPVMGKTAGCSVCMKVCPVQRFGLPAVLAEFEATGRILGKGTDDLEGYDWPVDGKHYGPGEKPRIGPELIETPGFDFDPNRTEPPSDTKKDLSSDERLGALGY